MTARVTDNFTLAGPHSPGSDVHVVLLGAAVVCRNCKLDGCVATENLSAAIGHLLRHVHHGHRVRRGLLEGLAVASAVLTARKGAP